MVTSARRCRAPELSHSRRNGCCGRMWSTCGADMGATLRACMRTRHAVPERAGRRMMEVEAMIHGRMRMLSSEMPEAGPVAGNMRDETVSGEPVELVMGYAREGIASGELVAMETVMMEMATSVVTMAEGEADA